MDVTDLIKINDLDKNELYIEYCKIKVSQDDLKSKNVKLNKQIKCYISTRKAYKSEMSDHSFLGG